MSGDEDIFPVINGRAHDFSSIRFNIAGDFYRGVTSIDYGNALDPGEARGNSPIALATTTGDSKPDGSLEMHKASYDRFIAKLGDGYMTRFFAITVTYGADGMPLSKDELLGVRIKKDRDSPKQGNAPPTVKVDLYITNVLRNGLSPVPTSQ